MVLSHHGNSISIFLAQRSQCVLECVHAGLEELLYSGGESTDLESERSGFDYTQLPNLEMVI